MNIELMQPLVIFPDDFFTIIKNESEFKIWYRLQYLNSKHEFKEDSITSILQFYSALANDRTFFETQLKFFLIRNAINFHYIENELVDLISLWEAHVSRKSQSGITLFLIGLQTFSVSLIGHYGKYYYDWNSYFNYISQWNKCTLELVSWKKFRFLSIPADFDFVKPMFRDQGGLNFSMGHMRMLFNEFVSEIYEKEFKPRLMNNILVEKEKSILERVLYNTGSEDDKKYLTNTFKLHNWKTVSMNLSKCLANEIYIQDIDIHSNLNYSKYFALLKYYEVLSWKPEKVQNIRLAMWFKNLPTDQDEKSEFYEILKDVFNMIRSNCPKAEWSDFKSIFSPNGSTVKIEWVGDASLLNYIFRSLNKVLAFNGSKWDVIAFYFVGKDKGGVTLTSKRLIGNSHYDDTNNQKLRERLHDLILTLNRSTK
jgi:hypothetical protein